MAAAVAPPAAPPAVEQRYQGVQKESAGYRLLSAMGWREGEGLGASKQGIKAHIRVKKKFENWGVGAVEAAEHAQSWTNGMLDYHRVLSNLSEVVSEHARRRASGSSSDDSGSGSGSDSDSDASGGEAPAPARPPPDSTRGGKPQPAKHAGGKRRKAAPPSAGEDGSSSSGGEEQAAPVPQRVRAATHLGRFKKREAAKMVKGYSQADLAAILGADPFAAAAAAVPEVRRAASPSGYDSDESSGGDSDAGGRQRAGAAQPAAAAAQQQSGGAAPPRQDVIVVRRPMAGGRPPAPPPPAPQEGRQPGWWQVCFQRAAGPAAGVGATAGAGITVHGFSEQDQTDLYNLAHDKATKGRVGLGRAGMPKKVAGARWEGTKTRIDDSDDDSQGGAAAGRGAAAERAPEPAAPGGVQLAAEEGLVIILPASKRHLLGGLQQPQQPQQQAAAPPGRPPPGGKKARNAAKKAAAAAAPAAAAPTAPAAAAVPTAAPTAAPPAGLERIKWKKAVAAALRVSGKGRMKLGKLGRAIARQHGVAKAQRGAALDALAAFLRGSPKWELRDGVVRPAAA